MAKCVRDTYQNGKIFRRGLEYSDSQIKQDVSIAGLKFFIELPKELEEKKKKFNEERERIQSITKINTSEKAVIEDQLAKMRKENEVLKAQVEELLNKSAKKK